MVPPDSRPPDDSSANAQRASDDPGFDEAALFTVIRAAVKDALLDVIGTLLLVGVAFVLLVVGAGAATEANSLVELAASLAVAGFGLYLAATALEILPPAREWLP